MPTSPLPPEDIHACCPRKIYTPVKIDQLETSAATSGMRISSGAPLPHGTSAREMCSHLWLAGLRVEHDLFQQPGVCLGCILKQIQVPNRRDGTFRDLERDLPSDLEHGGGQ